MSIEHQKQVANAILSKLETLDRGAILAGGAPRDWTLGRLASDLDFYFSTNESFNREEMMGMLSTLGLPNEIKGDAMYYNRNPYLIFVFEGIIDGEKVQLMYLSVGTKNVISTFALDICQAWYKGGIIHTTKDFDISIEKKIIRVTNNLYSHGDAYVQKILQKFPDFTFVGYTN